MLKTLPFIRSITSTAEDKGTVCWLNKMQGKEKSFMGRGSVRSLGPEAQATSDEPQTRNTDL